MVKFWVVYVSWRGGVGVGQIVKGLERLDEGFRLYNRSSRKPTPDLNQSDNYHIFLFKERPQWR